MFVIWRQPCGATSIFDGFILFLSLYSNLFKLFTMLYLHFRWSCLSWQFRQLRSCWFDNLSVFVQKYLLPLGSRRDKLINFMPLPTPGFINFMYHMPGFQRHIWFFLIFKGFGIKNCQFIQFIGPKFVKACYGSANFIVIHSAGSTSFTYLQ